MSAGAILRTVDRLDAWRAGRRAAENGASMSLAAFQTAEPRDERAAAFVAGFRHYHNADASHDLWAHDLQEVAPWRN